MLDPKDAARLLARERREMIVVPHPAFERHWTDASGAPHLDFLPPQTDGETAAFALGLAIARPDQRFMALDSEDGLLSSLGTLVTIAEAAPANLVHVLFQSGTRSGRAALPAPGGSRTNFAAFAAAAGYRNVSEFDDIETLAGDAARILGQPGPTMVVVRVAPRIAWDEAAPPRHDISDAMRRYRAALAAR